MKASSQHIIFVTLLLLATIWSCDKGKDKISAQSAASYKIAIVDSIQIDLFTKRITIMDVHDETGNILAVESSPPVVYIMDPKGKILNKMDRPGEGPQGVGARILSAEFYEDGIALMGQMRLKTYDMDFNVRKSLKPEYSPTGMIYVGFNHLMEFDGPNHKQLVAYFGGPQFNSNPSEKEHYEKFNIVDIVDPYLADESLTTEVSSEELFRPMGELTPNSKYLAGRAFYFITPVFDVKDNQFIYALKDDTTLYKRSLPEGDIVEQYKIPFDEFIIFKGYSMGPEGFAEQSKPGDYAGQIEKVYTVNGFDIVMYNSGMKLSALQALDKDAPDIRQQIDRINYKKHLILKDGQRVNSDLKLPSKVSEFILADKNGYLWGRKDLSEVEDEPEFVTFYKLKVVAQ